MKKRAPFISVLILCLLTGGIAQTPSPPTGQERPGEDEVVRISTNLVQLDAVVMDKSGKQVTDLRPADFEILEDGQPQAITNFSYISIKPRAEASVGPATPSVIKPGVPPTALAREQVRRTIVLVVDDLGMAFDDVRFVQRALKKFVDEQLQPGDMVGIVMTGGGGSALQQYTSDKRQLYAAIERVRWERPGRVGVSLNSGFKSIDPTLLGTTINTLSSIIDGMKNLPGRKSVLFFTDDFKIFKKVDDLKPLIEKQGAASIDEMAAELEQKAAKVEQRAIEISENVGQALSHYPNRIAELIDRANQASVVIYTVDARGLLTLDQGADAGDIRNKGAFSADGFEELRDSTRSTTFETQFALGYLARQTGGFLISNANDISRSIQRVLDDQNGYYLLGYRPPEETFKAGVGRFHKVEVRIKRPGLEVRSRKGFYSLPEEDKRPVRFTRNEQLKLALNSPFASTGVRLRSTALFGNTKQSGSFIRLFLHLDGRDLSFKEEADGWRSASIDVVAQAYSSDGGGNADTLAHTETVRRQGKSYERVLEEGLIYILNVPVKKPGAHLLRVAVRDVTSEHIGSTSQFVEVPDLAKNRLSLSGIAVNGSPTASAPASSPASTPQTSTSPPPRADKSEESGANALETQSGPAVRRLRQGMILDYGLIIYNADAGTSRPQLQTQLMLFRDGKVVHVGAARPFDPGGQSDMQRLTFSGRLQLGAALAPGQYILQVIVTDLLAKKEYRTATQWIDFEIVK
jgi:VWFA-related protein